MIPQWGELKTGGTGIPSPGCEPGQPVRVRLRRGAFRPVEFEACRSHSLNRAGIVPDAQRVGMIEQVVAGGPDEARQLFKVRTFDQFAISLIEAT